MFNNKIMILYTTLSYTHIIIVYILFVDWNDNIHILFHIYYLLIGTINIYADWNDEYLSEVDNGSWVRPLSTT